MLKFYKISSVGEVINYVSERLLEHLNRGESILWLLSGGSAIDLEIEIAKRIKTARDLAGLKVSLIDERYGETGHPDSNWQQLMSKGFDLPGAELYSILQDKDMQTTAADFETYLSSNLKKCDYSLALAGIGPDGHTLGIKPGSPALNTESLAVAYDWEDYRRITSTAEVLKRLDEVIVYAAGAEKKEQLTRLKDDVSPDDQPAQLLKYAPRVIIFNDQMDESD